MKQASGPRILRILRGAFVCVSISDAPVLQHNFIA